MFIRYLRLSDVAAVVLSSCGRQSVDVVGVAVVVEQAMPAVATFAVDAVDFVVTAVVVGDWLAPMVCSVADRRDVVVAVDIVAAVVVLVVVASFAVAAVVASMHVAQLYLAAAPDPMYSKFVEYVEWRAVVAVVHIVVVAAALDAIAAAVELLVAVDSEPADVDDA